MEIKFTKEQYKHLLDLLYMGNWTVNSPKDLDRRISGYDEIYRYITSFAGDFGYEDLFEYDEMVAGYAESQDYEDEMQKHIAEYDEDMFWDELAERLAKRDATKELGDSATIQEYMPKMIEKEEAYFNEFAANGVDNLIIKGK